MDLCWQNNAGITVLLREERDQSIFSLHYVKIQQEDSHLQARKKSPETESAGITLILDSPGSKVVKNICLLFKPPNP